LFRSLRFRIGSRRRGKKAEAFVTAEYLDDVLRDFSGYIAADELYDGPYCILSMVDNHKFRRILYEVLDHKPMGADIERFFSSTLNSRLSCKPASVRLLEPVMTRPLSRSPSWNVMM
jgi:hypothetical protein